MLTPLSKLSLPHVSQKKASQSISPKPFITIALTAAVLAGCQSGPFSKDQPVPEPRYIPDLTLGNEQVLTILPTKVPCNSSLPMLCVVAKQQTGDMFQIPYNWIEGFQHADGVQYDIKVRPQIDKNNEKMTGHWVLQNVISQQAK